MRWVFTYIDIYSSPHYCSTVLFPPLCWSHSFPLYHPCPYFISQSLGFSPLPPSWFSCLPGGMLRLGRSWPQKWLQQHPSAGGVSSTRGFQQHYPPGLKNAVSPLNGCGSMELGPAKLSLLPTGIPLSPWKSYCFGLSLGR